MDLQVPEVTHFIGPVKASSRAILAEASDGHFYILKMPGHLKGQNALYNEAAGYELYQSLGIPVPAWTAANVRPGLVANSPRSWPLSAGLCFASRFLTGPPVYGWLPGPTLNRILNRSDLWAAWVIDSLAHHSGNRQTLFVSSNKGMTAVFIDHSQLFGGVHGTAHPAIAEARYWDSRIYSVPNAAERSILMARLRSFKADNLLRRLKALPQDWKSSSAMNEIHCALERLSNPHLVQSTLEHLMDDVAGSLERRPEGSLPVPNISSRTGLRNAIERIRFTGKPSAYRNRDVAAD